MLNVSIKTAYSAALDTPFIAVLQLQESDKPMGPGAQCVLRCVLAGLCVRGQGAPSQAQCCDCMEATSPWGQLRSVYECSCRCAVCVTRCISRPVC